MIEPLPNHLLEIIRSGESTIVEFKTAKRQLPSNLFESICAMLNRCGGHIFLGVDDSGKILGVEKGYIGTMRKDFANLCNNPGKIFPTVLLDIKEFIWKNNHILYIYVHESSDVHRTANKFIDRKEDGDYDITNNTMRLSELYLRKRNAYAENKIFPFADLNDLRSDLITRARQMAIIKNPSHPWKDMSDFELLQSASLYERNLENGKTGLNLAGILLFGKDELIHSAIPHYKTDALLRIDSGDRYSDRDDIRTNLLDSFDRLTSFVQKHIDDKFVLDGIQRVSARDNIARELCANLLIHREYSNPYPARLIITPEAITTKNANRPRTIGYLNPNSFSPYPKNPKIASFFKEIGLADELGSGITKITKYTKLYSGGTPSFKEDEPFVATVPLVNNNQIMPSSTEIAKKILAFVQAEGPATKKDIVAFLTPNLDVKSPQKDALINNAIAKLRRQGHIINTGSKTSPLWRIV